MKATKESVGVVAGVATVEEERERDRHDEGDERAPETSQRPARAEPGARGR